MISNIKKWIVQNLLRPCELCTLQEAYVGTSKRGPGEVECDFCLRNYCKSCIEMHRCLVLAEMERLEQELEAGWPSETVSVRRYVGNLDKALEYIKNQKEIDSSEEKR